jgi:eukaryotic-like serine/threonine-protein kinase
VLDFGIARLREMSEKTGATQTGSMMGTPAFMAPEQARARWDMVDGRTDLWAVGATLFNAITGEYVHEAQTVSEALAMAVTQHARSVATVDPTIHPAVVALIDRALRYDMAERWQTARDMLDALREARQALLGGEPASNPRWSVPDMEVLKIDSPSQAAVRSVTSTSTTGRGVASTLADPTHVTTTARSRASRPLVMGGAALAAIAAVSVWLFAGSGTAPATSEEPPAAAAAPVAPAPAEPAAVPSEPAVQPSLQPAPAVEAMPAADPGEPEAEPAAAATQATPAVRARPAPRTTAQKPAVAKTTPRTQSGGGSADPFATRY